MDPNVQVAIATVVGTIVTTLGVVAVAMINAKRSNNSDPPDPKSKIESPEVLELVQSLVLENARKEASIQSLQAKIKELESAKENP